MVTILGICSTAAYVDCPNLPEHHIENSQDDEDPAFYYDSIGKYYWFDFDIVGFEGESLQLRSVFNDGDPDCNDGLWGAVWERSTARLIANILETGGESSVIKAVYQPFIEICESNKIWVPTTFEYGDDDTPLSWLSIRYASNLTLEKLVGLAIQLCYEYRYAGA